jgi:hypothetical protein
MSLNLGTMWPGVEPSQGSFSAEYIRKVKSIVSAAGARDIHTLLDMHQDVLSENFCGEGWFTYRLQADFCLFFYEYFVLSLVCS